MMVIAFVGSPLGMTPVQEATVGRLLWANAGRIQMVVHGDETGADVQFDWAAEQLGLVRQSRPVLPATDRRRALCTVEFPARPAASLAERDDRLRSDCGVLVAAVRPEDARDSAVRWTFEWWEGSLLPYVLVPAAGGCVVGWTGRDRNDDPQPWRLDCPPGVPVELDAIAEPEDARRRFFSKKSLALWAAAREDARSFVVLGFGRSGDPGA